MKIMNDQQCIRDIIEQWVIWRDSGQWDRLLKLWHDDGSMVSTWQTSRAAEFIAASQAAWERGLDVQHFLGGSVVEIRSHRAIAQTKMSISQRATLDDTQVDVTCIGRFYDFFEKRDDRWGIMRRQPIYERDRLDPIDPGSHVALDVELLAQFPSGYRHLGYLQTRMGLTVKRDLPGRTGAPLEALYREGEAWLAGQIA